MKKILSMLMTLLILGVMYSVKAENSRLYFIEKDNKLVYESNIEENVFMKHIDMLPGSKYTDELEIENGTQNDYTLYLKVEEVSQNELALELLESIDMKLYLDDRLIYNGKAKGLNYSDDGINLQNAIMLKEFKSKEKSLLRAETKLSEEYSNKNGDLSKINWVFYAQYEDGKAQIIENVPKTDVNNNIAIIISIIVLLLGIMIIFYYQKKKIVRK